MSFKSWKISLKLHLFAEEQFTKNIQVALNQVDLTFDTSLCNGANLHLHYLLVKSL